MSLSNILTAGSQNSADKTIYCYKVISDAESEFSAGLTITGEATCATIPSANDKLANKLYVDGAVASAGYGDVFGAASSIDNAIVRFDGTTGKIIQNSSTTIDDAGLLSVADITVSGNASCATAPTLGDHLCNKTYVDSASSGGDVVGPASSTDNAIARFDLTTGKLLQNSSATIDDSGLLNVADVSVSGNASCATAPTIGNHLCNKTYVDGTAISYTAPTSWVPSTNTYTNCTVGAFGTGSRFYGRVGKYARAQVNATGLSITAANTWTSFRLTLPYTPLTLNGLLGTASIIIAGKTLPAVVNYTASNATVGFMSDSSTGAFDFNVNLNYMTT